MNYLKCYSCYDILDDKQEIFTHYGEILRFCSKCATMVREDIEKMIKEKDGAE